MKGIIRDTGLDHLIRLLFKQDLALPTQHSTWWRRCYYRTAPQNPSQEAPVGSGSPRNVQAVEMEPVQRRPNGTLDGLEHGVVEDVVGWHGPNDPEVLLESTP